MLVLAEAITFIFRIRSSSVKPATSTMRCGFAGMATSPFISVTVTVSETDPCGVVSVPAQAARANTSTRHNMSIADFVILTTS